MANPTQLWPGERMRRFFRAIYSADAQVDNATADRLAQNTMRYVNRMLVLDSEPVPSASSSKQNVQAADPTHTSPAPKKHKKKRAAGGGAKSAKANKTKPSAPKPTEALDLHASETEAGVPWISPDEVGADAVTTGETELRAPTVFDPFAFSAVVVLARQGQKGLLALLAEIDDPAHLRQLAEAQHLGIDRKIVAAEKLREAIVKGAAQRIADRRAAAG